LLLPKLQQFIPEPVQIEEVLDTEIGRYSIKFREHEFVIYSPDQVDKADSWSWGKATFVFFHIVNEQLTSTSHGFYAIMGGNDLGGMFLTTDEVDKARKSLPMKRDWPYLPVDQPPWFGEYH
jgi:hypothetical protein